MSKRLREEETPFSSLVSAFTYYFPSLTTITEMIGLTNTNHTQNDTVENSLAEQPSFSLREEVDQSQLSGKEPENATRNVDQRQSIDKFIQPLIKPSFTHNANQSLVQLIVWLLVEMADLQNRKKAEEEEQKYLDHRLSCGLDEVVKPRTFVTPYQPYVINLHCHSFLVLILSSPDVNAPHFTTYHAYSSSGAYADTPYKPHAFHLSTDERHLQSQKKMKTNTNENSEIASTEASRLDGAEISSGDMSLASPGAAEKDDTDESFSPMDPLKSLSSLKARSTQHTELLREKQLRLDESKKRRKYVDSQRKVKGRQLTPEYEQEYRNLMGV